MDVKRILGSNLLVHLNKLNEEEVTESGIILPNKVRVEKAPEGIVKGLGDSVKEVEKGDRILFSKYDIKRQFEIEKEPYILICEKEIYGIVGKEGDV